MVCLPRVAYNSIILQLIQKFAPDLNHLLKNNTFNTLRNDYPFFEYQSYDIIEKKDSYLLVFNFNLANKFHFKPEILIPKRVFFVENPSAALLHNLAFHIGMVELISYWKATCSPTVIIHPFQLTNSQILWWKKLYFNGLGEFFYLNKIETSMDDFMEIRCHSAIPTEHTFAHFENNVIVPIGGGKDSVVSLELLRRSGFPMIPIMLNPRPASLNCAATADFQPNDCVLVYRSIDNTLLEMNAAGFLNGHTPFSALLAFVSAFAAVLCGSKHIALSNESSASESTVHGQEVNHQYSKSLAFERDFREYIRQYVVNDLNYFSLLRPLNELQITRLFSEFKQYHSVFRSCNVGSKTDSWCCNCSKCLFTYLMLAPFNGTHELVKIFGENLMIRNDLQFTFNELMGKTVSKPFECVGTVEEVRAAASFVADTYGSEGIPPLIQSAQSDYNAIADRNKFQQLLSQFDEAHFLIPEFKMLVKNAVDGK